MRTETKLLLAGIIGLGALLVLTDPDFVQEALQAAKILERKSKTDRPDTDPGRVS